jgi:DNA-binding PadR family transcriptional regulator
MKSLTRREEQILLAVFHLQDEAYLIPIREMIKKYTGKYYSVGTIYAPLNKLHIDGYLDAILIKPSLPDRGKPIKYYKLTKKGFRALEQLKLLHAQMWEGFISPVLEK